MEELGASASSPPPSATAAAPCKDTSLLVAVLDGSHGLVSQALRCPEDARPIGTGGGSLVLEGTYGFRAGAAPEPVAVKVFLEDPTETGSTLRALTREIELGASLDHPHLVRTFGILMLPSGRPGLVMELLSGGTLAKVAMDRRRHPTLAPADVLRWMHGVADGMEHLHGMKPAVVHRDLKGANVLLTYDLRTAKVCDFGIATVTQTMRTKATTRGMATYAKTGTKGSMAGTLGWKAPETFYGRAHRASDVFAFAMTLYEVAARQPPFANETEIQVIQKLMRRVEEEPQDDAAKARFLHQYPLKSRRPPLPAAAARSVPSVVIELMQRCWVDDPVERPTFIELKGLLAVAMEAAFEQEERHRAVTGADPDTRTVLAELNAIKLQLSDGFYRMHADALQEQRMLTEAQTALDRLQERSDAVLGRLDDMEDLVLATQARLRQKLGVEVPWAFAVWPEIAPGRGRSFMRPSTWFNDALRVHLLCNGCPRGGVGPHFLFATAEELRNDGYRMLRPKAELSKWGTALKITLHALLIGARTGLRVLGTTSGDDVLDAVTESLALTIEGHSHGKGRHASAMAPPLSGDPGLGATAPGFRELFRANGLGEMHDAELLERVEAVLGSAAEHVGPQRGADGEISEPELAAAAGAMADWLKAQDAKRGGGFFGLSLDPASLRPGAGGPQWRCQACARLAAAKE